MSIARGATGALSGAATGATVGSAVPVIGTAAGAAIGGLVGLVGGLFGGGGSTSGGDGRKKSRRALKIQNELTLDSLKRDAALAIQANEKAARLYNDLVNQKYAQDLKNYETLVEERENAYNQAFDAYQESVKAFDDNVELNDISATMAMNDANRVYNDKRQALNEQGQALTMELEANRRDSELVKSMIASRQATTEEDAKLQIASARLKLGSNLRGLQTEEELIQSRMGSSIRDAELNSAGVSARLASAIRDGSDAIARSTRAFESQTQMAEYDLEINRLQLGVDKELLKGEMKQLEAEKFALIDSTNLKTRDVLASLDNSIAEADFGQQELRLAKDERYAEAAIQTDQLRRQGLLEQSAQIAKGQSGRSAAKATQGLAFANQQAQALLASALVRADSKYLIDKNKIIETLNLQRYQGRSSLEATSIDVRKANSQFAQAQIRMAARKEEIAQRYVEADKAREGLAEAGRITSFQNRQTANQMADAKTFADLEQQGIANTISDVKKEGAINLGSIANKKGDAIEMEAIERGNISNQLLASQADFHNQLVKNDNQMYDLEEQAKLSFSSLAYAGQSLDDELKINKERIEFDQAIADAAAAENILPHPEMPPPIPPPIKAPDLVQTPMPEIDWNKIAKSMKMARKAGMSYNPSGLSEFTSLMSNISNIGEQAAAVAESFQAPPTITKKSEDLFPIKYNDPTRAAAGLSIMQGNTGYTSNVNLNTSPMPFNNTLDIGVLGSNTGYNANVNLVTPPPQ